MTVECLGFEEAGKAPSLEASRSRVLRTVIMASVAGSINATSSRAMVSGDGLFGRCTGGTGTASVDSSHPVTAVRELMLKHRLFPARQPR